LIVGDCPVNEIKFETSRTYTPLRGQVGEIYRSFIVEHPIDPSESPADYDRRIAVMFGWSARPWGDSRKVEDCHMTDTM
jgi:hypothetical protein